MRREERQTSHTGARKDTHGVLVRKPDGKRPLRRLRCRWEDNIKMVLREIRRKGFDWCSVAGSCECGDELKGS